MSLGFQQRFLENLSEASAVRVNWEKGHSCAVVHLRKRVSHSSFWSAVRGVCDKQEQDSNMKCFCSCLLYCRNIMPARFKGSFSSCIFVIPVCVCVFTLRMNPSGQVSWSYHMALYMSRRSRLVRKAKLMKIRPVIWAENPHVYYYGNDGSFQTVVCVDSLF